MGMSVGKVHMPDRVHPGEALRPVLYGRRLPVIIRCAGLEGQIRTGRRRPPSLGVLLRRRDSGRDPIGPCSLGSEDSKLSAPALAQ
jgi:hypothetical protein